MLTCVCVCVCVCVEPGTVLVDQNYKKLRKFSRVCFSIVTRYLQGTVYNFFKDLFKELFVAMQAQITDQHLSFFLFVFVFELSVLNIFIFRTSTVGTFVPGTVNGLADFHLCRV